MTLPTSPRAAPQAGLAVLSFRTANYFRPVVKPLPESLPPCNTDAARDTRHAVLLAATAQGDANAFEQFYTLTIGVATAVVRRVSGNNHTEDVLSDAYFQAWQQVSLFDPQRGSALSWFLTIARSRALDRWRVESVRHGGQSGAPDFDAQALEDESGIGPDTLLESTQASSRLHAALTRLSSNERWVLGLAYFRELTHTEIATLTGLPLGTIKSLINRSQHKLREAMASAASTTTAPKPL